MEWTPGMIVFHALVDRDEETAQFDRMALAMRLAGTTDKTWKEYQRGK